MTKVSSIVKPGGAGVITAIGQTTVKEAVLLMTRSHVGSILVRDGENFGIFTERDLLTRVIARDRDPRTTVLAEAMTTPVKTCSPNDDVAAVVDMMIREHIRHAVVADGNRIVGIISLRDVIVQSITDVRDLILRHSGRADQSDSSEGLSAASLQLDPAIEMMLEASGTDQTTGLANEKHFAEALERFHQQTRRYGRELSVLIVKLGSMGQIMRELDARAADKLLKNLASTVKSLCRRADMPARLGEDIFGFILPETVASGAVRLAKRMKQALAKVSQQSPFDLSARISIGIADISSGDMSCGAYLKKMAADAMTRAAKHSPDGIIVASAHIPLEPPDESAV
ncbi:MAG: GGDEF domain-containing protein [Planctomycetes bacterium]|nr:GGDEF domain-containing protein [Planctomycetota bacterium]